VIIAGDEPRDLGRASLDPPAVRRNHSDPGLRARHDVHGVVDAFCVALRELAVAAKVVKGSLFRHRYSLPPRRRTSRGLLSVGELYQHHADVSD
jgi:hypothetical protein